MADPKNTPTPAAASKGDGASTTPPGTGALDKAKDAAADAASAVKDTAAKAVDAVKDTASEATGPDTKPAPATGTTTTGSTTSAVADDLAGKASASTEPITQATAYSLPPTPTPTHVPPPDSYRMPDDYAQDSFFDRTKEWVEQNPGLAILAFAGVGLITGRLLTSAFKSEPETLADRVEARAKELGEVAGKRGRAARKEAEKAAARYAKEAKKTGRRFGKKAESAAHDAEDWAEDAAGRARVAFKGAAETVAEKTHDGVERTKDLAETVADAVKVAVAAVAAKAADEWASRGR